MATRKDPLQNTVRGEAEEVWSKYDYDNFVFVSNEIKDMSRLIKNDTTRINHIEQTLPRGMLMFFIRAVFVLAVLTGIGYVYIFRLTSGYDIFPSPSPNATLVFAILLLTLVALTLPVVVLPDIRSRSTLLRLLAIEKKYLSLKVELADEILARTAAWLDRGRVPHIQHSLIVLHFRHDEYVVAQARQTLERSHKDLLRALLE